MITEYRIMIGGKTLGKHLSHKQAILQLRKEEANTPFGKPAPELRTTTAKSLRELRRRSTGRQGLPSRRVKRALRRLSAAKAGMKNSSGYRAPGAMKCW